MTEREPDAAELLPVLLGGTVAIGVALAGASGALDPQIADYGARAALGLGITATAITSAVAGPSPPSARRSRPPHGGDSDAEGKPSDAGGGRA
jgi:hypothetical protein